MKILFLIPPSEGKNPHGKQASEKLSFSFEKPLFIAENATEKDMKCGGDRFTEAIFLNKNITSSSVVESIFRYSGVMFNAIGYESMNEISQQFFDKNFWILSGMYGIVKPRDLIGNYKLPIETKGLYKFWGEKIFEKILEEKPDYIVNFLPISYEKMIHFSKHKNTFAEKNIRVLSVHFLKSDGTRISHQVKKIKGKFIREICENTREKIIENEKIVWENEVFGNLEIYENEENLQK